MKANDLFEESYSALTVNKVRTTLTMLGIVIGIGSVIAMVAIGQGSQASVASSIQSIGSNLIVVTPGAQRTPGSPVSLGLGSSETLTTADEQAIAQLPDIKAADQELSKRYQVTTPGLNTNTTVLGTDNFYPEVRNLSIAQGTFITAQQVANDSKVAVLGQPPPPIYLPQGLVRLARML